MNTHHSHTIRRLFFFCLTLIFPLLTANAIGLSEPGITLYGKVWTDENVVFKGDLTWTYTSDSGEVIEVTVPLREIPGKNGDAYSYRAYFPAGSDLDGEGLSSNRLAVTDEPTVYRRTAEIDGVSVQISGNQVEDTFSATELGKTERVDLAISSSDVPTSTITGKVDYDGLQKGPIRVQVAVNQRLFDETRVEDEEWRYEFSDVPAGDYRILAFRDSDGDGLVGAAEAQGEFGSNPVQLPPSMTGIDVLLVDPDRDGDGLADWWELRYFGNLAHGLEDDSDGDGRLNNEEYGSQTNPATEFDQSCTLSVVPGWNFVSISVEPEDTSTAAFVSDHDFITQIVDWNGANYMYTSFILPNVGYWMHSREQKVFDVFGKFPADRFVQLYRGWNLIGADSEILIPMKKEIRGPVWWWDAETEGFRQVDGDWLIPSRGYWIYAMEETEVLLGE